jgi:hypothetical protein
MFAAHSCCNTAFDQSNERNLTTTGSKLGHDFLLFLGDLLLKQMTQYFRVNKHIMADNIRLGEKVNYISLNIYVYTRGFLNSRGENSSFNYYQE